MVKMHSSFWNPIRPLQRPVTFDSDRVTSRSMYLGYCKFLRDSIFEGFSANGAKQIGEKEEKVKKSRFCAKNARLGRFNDPWGS